MKKNLTNGEFSENVASYGPKSHNKSHNTNTYTQEFKKSENKKHVVAENKL
jgi:hypothetical protein